MKHQLQTQISYPPTLLQLITSPLDYFYVIFTGAKISKLTLYIL